MPAERKLSPNVGTHSPAPSAPSLRSRRPVGRAEVATAWNGADGRANPVGSHFFKKTLDLGLGSRAYPMVRWTTLLRIGDLAQRCDVSRDTLRFYEREGLISPTNRSDAGYRLYGEADAERVQFIRRAQAVGLTLDDIRELLTVQRLRTPGACRRVAERLKARIQVIDRRVAELNSFRRELAKGLAQCDDGANSCPVVLSFASPLPKGALR